MQQLPQAETHQNPQDNLADINRSASVICRVRPLLPYETDQQLVFNSNPNSYLYQPVKNRFGDVTLQEQIFSFDHTFAHTDSNEIVYSSLQFERLINLFFNSGVVTCMSFGQTSSGKTYTTTYLVNRVLQDLFNLNSENKYSFQMQYFEIFGEKCTDLMTGTEIFIKEDNMRNIVIQNVQTIQLETFEQAYTCIKQGQQSRLQTATQRNNHSSRSHAVLKLMCTNNACPIADIGEFYIIDLAGSEGSGDRTEHDRELIKQAAAINSSLMVLKSCLQARMVASSREGELRYVHIPYRNSKLTLLLKECFELSSIKKSHTMIIAHVTPCEKDVKQSVNTLKYVSQMKIAVQNAKILNVNPENPVVWDPVKVNQFISEASNNRIKPETITGDGMSGLQLCKLPEPEFIQRAMTNPGVGEKAAKHIYLKLWNKVIDAKMVVRKELKKPVMTQKDRDQQEQEYLLELIKRSK
ncbi:Kinesin-7 [Hexamita inflata]|uniref:Kinesin-like protein n=1 Tax=Hexamita inflata TaxID=28002 RepID=A0AA86QQM1_9EUKA|nr:Kinesin-7 [Hexamita inflata]